MDSIDATHGRLLRASSHAQGCSFDSTPIVVELREIVTELKALRSDSACYVTEIKAIRSASVSCKASMQEVRRSVAHLATIKTCLESILLMVSTSTEKVLSHFKHVPLQMSSIWLRLAAASTYCVKCRTRLDSLKDAFKADYRYQTGIWEDLEANPVTAESSWENCFYNPVRFTQEHATYNSQL
ncbi:hypothetical protein R1flu_011466 [Riccia fluitans]|uniref:Uncharacterized protein n=1 Tax=Riccia fluitans TaxID=41844 RepID=A0ABD1ZAH5_9MARC